MFLLRPVGCVPASEPCAREKRCAFVSNDDDDDDDDVNNSNSNNNNIFIWFVCFVWFSLWCLIFSDLYMTNPEGSRLDAAFSRIRKNIIFTQTTTAVHCDTLSFR